MINYKYPTIVPGATPIGSDGRAPDEELLWEDNEENFKSIVGGKHQKINLTFHSHLERGFKNSTISAIALANQIEDWRNQRLKHLKKLKIDSRRLKKLKHLKKSKIKEVEDWRS
jgi:hypothetical protein